MTALNPNAYISTYENDIEIYFVFFSIVVFKSIFLNLVDSFKFKFVFIFFVNYETLFKNVFCIF